MKSEHPSSRCVPASPRRRASICGLTFALFVLLANAGCSNRVRVDCRVAADGQDALQGPAYVIRGAEEQTEASLAFQEFADTFGGAMDMKQPNLHRVGYHDPADFAILLQVSVVDLGTGIVSRPVYGHGFARAYGPCGPGYVRTFGVVGSETYSVHEGFAINLFASAYVMDSSAPGGRRVLWEGTASRVEDEADPAAAVPRLALALASCFGMATDGPDRVTPDGDEVKALRKWVRAGGPATSRPASLPADD